MAVKKQLSEAQINLFEQELLQVLKQDPDHQFAFDGKLCVQSRRYRCEIKAVNVRWDPDKGDLVLVGAFLRGEPVVDMSKGFPVFKTEIEIPFRECLQDLKANPSTDESALLSKARRAVIDKCIGYPMKLLRGAKVTSDGVPVVLDEFRSKGGPGTGMPVRVTSGLPGAMVYGETSVHSVEQTPEGLFSVKGVCGGVLQELNLSRMSLPDIQRIGGNLRGAYALILHARRDFRLGKEKFVRPGSTSDAATDRLGEAEGLACVYEKGYPMRVCDSVAKTFCVQYADLFSEILALDGKMRSFRKTGLPFDSPKGLDKGIGM